MLYNEAWAELKTWVAKESQLRVEAKQDSPALKVHFVTEQMCFKAVYLKMCEMEPNIPKSKLFVEAD